MIPLTNFGCHTESKNRLVAEIICSLGTSYVQGKVDGVDKRWILEDEGHSFNCLVGVSLLP